MATRPLHSNGLALTPHQAARIMTRIEQIVILLRDTPQIYDAWRHLVAAHRISGKPSHDARLVSAMQIHGIRHLLTFNNADFTRYTDISVLTPQEIGAKHGPSE